MKFLLICLLPMVMSIPALKKRVLLDSLSSLFDLDTMKCDIQIMLDAIGNDPSEQACESECHQILQDGHTLNYGCPLVCHGFQNLVHVWHVVPDTTDPSVSKCNTAMQTTTAAAKKRLVLDTFLGTAPSLFNLDSLKCDVQKMVDVVGSDPLEAACEDECHKLIKDGNVFAYSCPLVCHGFQSLVHLWHVVPDTTDPSVSKCGTSVAAVGK